MKTLARNKVNWGIHQSPQQQNIFNKTQGIVIKVNAKAQWHKEQKAIETLEITNKVNENVIVLFSSVSQWKPFKLRYVSPLPHFYLLCIE